MCDDHISPAGDTAGQLGTTAPFDPQHHHEPGPGWSRRQFVARLGAAAGMSALGAISGIRPGAMTVASASSVPVPPAPGLDGALSHRTAQHIHARGSEGAASMTSQAAEAAQHVEAMWFTDHDWREAGVGAPTQIHFNSLLNEALPPNKPWMWERHNSGALDPASSKGGIDPSDVSPNDPDPAGALYARALGLNTGQASLAWYGNDLHLRNSMRTPAHGQVWTVDVKLREASGDSWGFARVALSYHPAGHGRPTAYYFLEYRFGPFAQPAYSIEQLDLSGQAPGGGDDGGGPATVTLRPGEQALLGVVWVPQQVGNYVTHQLSFTDDIAAVFPGMIARDNSIRGAWFGATSRNGAPGNAAFDYLRMSRVTGNEQFVDRRAITDELAASFPTVALYNGTELSYGGGHRQWLGGDVTLPNYDTAKATGAPSPSNTALVGSVLAAGGLPIANHPFGTNGPNLSDAAAAAKSRAYVQALKSTNAEGGLQGLETFYRKRAGATFEQHWWLARLAIRNGFPLTLTGTSDNHGGGVGTWATEGNRFVTGIYAGSVNELAMIDALRRGRAYSAEIGSYNGQLDLSLDDRAVMGQIDVRPGVVSRQLNIQATALTGTNMVEVYQIPIDASMDGEPGGVIATLPPSAFVQGMASIQVDTTRDSAFAVMVCARSKPTVPYRRTGGSNPVWHLTQEPTTWRIPAFRRPA